MVVLRYCKLSNINKNLKYENFHAMSNLRILTCDDYSPNKTITLHKSIGNNLQPQTSGFFFWPVAQLGRDQGGFSPPLAKSLRKFNPKINAFLSVFRAWPVCKKRKGAEGMGDAYSILQMDFKSSQIVSFKWL